VTNVDRTDRNVNLLLWQQQLWLIDHGAALYFHHDWTNYAGRILSPFAMIRQHTLLPLAAALPAADRAAHSRLDRAQLEEIVAATPAAWLGGEAQFADTTAHRAAYVTYLDERLRASEVFMEEAIRARQLRV
jgi:hypothetical protein